MSSTLDNLPLTLNDGRHTDLAAYRGRVALIVNVASRCGLTPQYEGLEQLYRDKHDDGLEILAFPANDFNGQEPGSDAEIRQFCELNYQVSFPLFAKISVTGQGMHPLYRQLTAAQPEAQGDGPFRERLAGHGMTPSTPPAVLWNFEKFLVSRDGRVIARFAPDITADDPRLRAAIDNALAQPA